MKIVYRLITLLALAIIAWSVRSLYAENARNTPPPAPTIPQGPEAYNFYTEDKEVDSFGTARRYNIEGRQADWVRLTCNEEGFLKTTFKGNLGFNPKTGDGGWSGQWPDLGKQQTAEVHVAPDGYGGYHILFVYDDGNRPCKGKLVPIIQ